MLDNARAVVAECLGVRPDEVTFTPSGTHAVHLGVLGLLAGPGPSRGPAARPPASSTRRSCRPAPGTRARRPVRDAAGRPSRPGRPRRVGAAPSRTTASRPCVALQSANPEVGVLQPVAEVADCASRRRCSSTPAPRRAGSRCPAAGQPPPPRRTSGVARPGSASCWCASGARWRNPFPGDDRVDERATGFENVPAALAAAAALRAVSGRAARCSPGWHALRLDDAMLARRGPGHPGHRGVPGAGRPAAAPRRVLLPLRRRRGPRDRARPARVRGGERVGLHREHARAEPRARRDGRADPRQRPGLAGPRHRRPPTCTGWPTCCPASSSGCAPRSGGAPMSPTVELDCRGMACPRPVIELARAVARRRGGRHGGRDRRRPGCRGRRAGVVPHARPGVRRRRDRRGRRTRSTWCGGVS